MNLPALALLEPENDFSLFFQNLNKNSVFLKWKTIKDANNYELQVSTDYNFKKILYFQNLKSAQTRYFPPKIEGTFYWRVRYQTDEQLSPWSTIWSIVIVTGRVSNQDDLNQ